MSRTLFSVARALFCTPSALLRSQFLFCMLNDLFCAARTPLWAPVALFCASRILFYARRPSCMWPCSVRPGPSSETPCNQSSVPTDEAAQRICFEKLCRQHFGVLRLALLSFTTFMHMHGFTLIYISPSLSIYTYREATINPWFRKPAVWNS
jgi:hypothetical protein